MDEPLIDVQHVCKTFAPAEGPVLDDISFSLFPGETLSVIGPSGCGKTTLLYILAGLKKSTSGRVAICGSDGNTNGGTNSFILQNFGLFPWKTVYENVSLGLKLRKTEKSKTRQITNALLSELDIGELSDRYPVQLSGGQKQRVAIARALATEPDVLLMDEPFSSLDALTRERLQDIMLDMWHTRRLTYIIVTHSVEEAVFLGKYILVLTDRPTRCKTLITNDTYGDKALRNKDCYFDRVRQVRKEMEIR
ncbi:MAG: ABC transporter ATP-binding protein [Desulfobacteraceae bacterium]|nr:ABC transporter ATP-binding protein [Desulfobacteraceae bacterium]